MSNEAAGLARAVARRIFLVQITIVLTMLALVIISDRNPDWFGFDFWLSFFVGALGSSIALLRRIRTEEAFLQEVGRSTIDTMLPVLYGAMLAGLTYALFMSGILSGDGGSGLLTTNLFPRFAPDATVVETDTLVHKFLHSQPTSVADLGKLLVWCFLAGYSEKFVINILGQLDRPGEKGESARSDSPP